MLSRLLLKQQWDGWIENWSKLLEIVPFLATPSLGIALWHLVTKRMRFPQLNSFLLYICKKNLEICRQHETRSLIILYFPKIIKEIYHKICRLLLTQNLLSATKVIYWHFNPYPATFFFGPENVVCLVRLLHILKYTWDFFCGTKHYRPWSDVQKRVSGRYLLNTLVHWIHISYTGIWSLNTGQVRLRMKFTNYYQSYGPWSPNEKWFPDDIFW